MYDSIESAVKRWSFSLRLLDRFHMKRLNGSDESMFQLLHRALQSSMQKRMLVE